MSNFITQAEEENPSVLIISDVHPFTRKFHEFFEQKNLTPREFSPAQLATPALIEQLKAQEFYKIVWFVPDICAAEPYLSAVFSWVETRAEPVVVVTTLQTLWETECPELQPYLQHTRREQYLFQQFLDHLPEASMLLGQDVVVEKSGFWRGISQFFTPTKVFLSDAALHLVRAEDFWNFLSQQILKPRLPHLQLCQGPGVSQIKLVREGLASSPLVRVEAQELVGCAVVIQDVNQAIDKTTKTKVSPLTEFKECFFSQVQIPQAVSAPKPEPPAPLVESPKPARMAVVSNPVTPAFLQKKHVQPHVMPKIENRQKKLEQKMEQLARERETQKYLRAAPLQEVVLQQQQSGGVLSREESAKLEQSLQQMFGQQRIEQKTVRITHKVKATAKIQHKQLRQRRALRVVAGFGGLALSALLMVGFFLFSRRQVLALLVQSFSSNTVQEESRPSGVAVRLRQFGQVLGGQVSIVQVVAGSGSLSESKSLAELAERVSEVSVRGEGIRGQLGVLMDQFLAKKSGSLFDTLQELSNNIQEMYKDLSFVQTQLSSINQSFLSGKQQNDFQKFTLLLQEQRKLLATSTQLQQLAGSLFAQNGKKTYVLFLQNNQELRATGGLFHALALITIEKGKLIDYQVFEVKAVDAMAKGQVAAPPELRKYLNQSQWLLRDVGWSPSFPETAKSAQGFVERSLGRKVDGTLAINVFVLQDLLKVVGPIELPEYQETVNERNIFERVEFHSEVNLVGAAKSDYLTSLFNATLTKVFALPTAKAPQLLKTLYTEAVNGQMFVYLPTETENSVLSGLGWTGELASPQCPSQLSDVKCVVDSVMQVESNVGANTANHWVERSIQHQVEIGKAERRHTRTMTFHNTAVSNSWPAGEYKNYLRLYVPLDAKYESIDVDGVRLPLDQVTIQQEQNRKYFGFLLAVPIQKTSVVKVVFTQNAELETPFAYAFFDQKQAGTPDDSLQISLVFKDGLRPLVIAPEGKVDSSSVRFQLLRDKHAFVGVKLN